MMLHEYAHILARPERDGEQEGKTFFLDGESTENEDEKTLSRANQEPKRQENEQK